MVTLDFVSTAFQVLGAMSLFTIAIIIIKDWFDHY